MWDRTKDDDVLHSVKLQNAQSELRARQKAEKDLILANEALAQKNMELAYSLSMMRATLESTTDGILVTDDAGKVTGFNENYIRMWNLSREVMERADHRRLVSISQPLKESVAQSERLDAIYATWPPETFDLLELRDGRVFERFSKIQTADNRNVGRVWSYREITERRRNEEALREERHVLEVLNQIGATIASTLDLQTLVQAVTDAATTLSEAGMGAFFFNSDEDRTIENRPYASAGVPPEAFDISGRSLVAPLFGPELKHGQAIRCEDVSKDSRYGAIEIRHSISGLNFPVRSYMAVPVVSRSGHVIGGLFFTHPETGIFDERDERIMMAVAGQAAVAIDNARLFEAAQRSAEEREILLERERMARASAERMGELKDEFLANLSHELRTPLNAIVGWSKVLRRGVEDETDLRNGLDTIEKNARIQTQLIDDLLDMNRIASGKVRLDMQPIAPVSFIEAAIETVRPAADAKGIHIEKTLDLLAAPISGDPNRLQQVIWNLLSNAIKFTPPGGHVQVALARKESDVEVSVSDSGIGIKPEFQPHVFERFRQEKASANRKFGGLGLGLSIVKHLVELHGGTVRVESAGEGCGATFSVILPMMPVHPASEGQFHASSVEPDLLLTDFAAVNLSGLKVLVVDDDLDARNLIQRILVDCHADVFTAGSAGDALQLIEDVRPHVLVSDIGMPDIDGYELLKRVRMLGQMKGGKMPAIALTAFARSEDRTRALRAGFLVHVSKPVEPSELIASVASVAGRNIDSVD